MENRPIRSPPYPSQTKYLIERGGGKAQQMDFLRSHLDDLVKSHKNYGFVKSSRCKARKT
jgi:hypothetical protein